MAIPFAIRVSSFTVASMVEDSAATSPLLLDAAALFDLAEVLRAGLGERRARAELSFPVAPHHFGYLVFAGLGPLTAWLESSWLTDADLNAVRACSALGPSVVHALESMRCRLDVDAAPEATIVFPGEPVLAVEGPLAQVVVVGPLVQAMIGSATLVATRAARLAWTAGGDEVVDNSTSDGKGLIALSRAAYVGGCAATTNLLAASRWGIPLSSGPRDGVIDLCRSVVASTSDTAGWGAAQGDRMVEFASLDEELEMLERRRAGERGRWLLRSLAVLPKLATRWDLTALQQGPAWTPRLGFPPDPFALPGRKLVVRYAEGGGRPIADLVQAATERVQPPPRVVLIGTLGPACPIWVEGVQSATPLMIPALRAGRMAAAAEHLDTLRRRTLGALELLDPELRRLRSPGEYLIGTSAGLYELRAALFSSTPNDSR